MTDKFKAGDKVVRTGYSYNNAIKGDVYTVLHIGVGSIELKEVSGIHLEREFDILQPFDIVQPLLKGFFRIKDKEHSKIVQEHLFSLGYEWMNLGKLVIHTDASFIYVDKYVSHGSGAYGRHNGLKEYTLESYTTYSTKEITPDPVETINIGGMEYSKEDVENALKGLQPIYFTMNIEGLS